MALNPSMPLSDRLLKAMEVAFFNVNGMFIMNEQGKYIRHQGALLTPSEVPDIENILDTKQQSAIFSLRYNQQGGYYLATRFTGEKSSFYVVTRCTYEKLSDIIYRGSFPEFEMLLLNRKDHSVIIRKGYYANSGEYPVLSPEQQNALLFRTPLDNTPWDMAALPDQKRLNILKRRHISEAIIVLVIFSALASVLWYYLCKRESQSRAIDAIHREAARRADKALMSIDDALITTTLDGTVSYINPKADALLRQQGVQNAIGHSLSDAWPDAQALWNRGLDLPELEALQDKTQQLHMKVDGQTCILEQSYNLLYEDDAISGAVWLLRDVTTATLAHRDLQNSRKRYKALFDEASVAHCLLDISQYQQNNQSYSLTKVNEAAVQLFQADSQADLLSGSCSLPCDPLLHKAIRYAIELQLSTTEFEMQLGTLTGELIEVWVHLSMHSGEQDKVLMTLLDITERKRAAEEIRERESFWSRVMAAMPQLVYVMDVDEGLQTQTVFRNSTLSEVLGYPLNEDQTTPVWSTHLAPEDKHFADNHIHKIAYLAMGETLTEVARFINVKGETRILEFSETPFNVNDQGRVTRYIGTARDVTEDINKQNAIQDSERRYRMLAENISDVIWSTDRQLRFNYISPSVERLLGYTPEEILEKGNSCVFTQSQVSPIIKRLQSILDKASQSPGNYRQRDTVVKEDLLAITQSGERKLLEVQASLAWNEEGQPEGILGISRDITEARKIEQELHLAAEVFANSNEAILITDQSMNIVSANNAFQTITGFDPEQVNGQTLDLLISPEYHSHDMYDEIGKALIREGYWQGEIFYKRHDNTTRTGWAGISAIRNSNEDVQSLIVIMSDISERKAIEERIHRLAYFDSLTGLPNRSHLHEQLENMIHYANKKHEGIALLFLDLDRFKPINDSMGHPAGDQVLKEVAGRLLECTKKHDLVCRMGGDEFTIVLGQQDNGNAAADVAVHVGERILHTLHQPFILDKRQVFISASIGIAVFPDDGLTVTELLKNSDMAMYHAKELGRDNVQFFNSRMNQKAVERLEMENDLRQAMENRELKLYFQPQYQADSKKAVGAEALLRWLHPRHGMVAPDIFIPIIEDTGLIIPIGRWVLEQSCQMLAKWQRQGYNIGRIAVNVSARQFKQSDFVNVIESVIQHSGINSQQLELELTESILIDDMDHTLGMLKALRHLGVNIAIDDFGTGYSSLNYLKQFPVDNLKIDRSFIKNLPDNTDDAQITRTIIAMAHNLGLGVIAEGVETLEQLAFLNEEQCEEIQGFLFSKPLPEKEFLKKLDESAQPDNENSSCYS